MALLRDKLFIASSLGMTCGFMLLCKNILEIKIFLGIYLATIGNLLLLQIAVKQILFLRETSKGKMVGIFLGKMLLMLGALILGVHFIGGRVVIPILNYVVQIFIFGLCLKRQRERTLKK